MKVLRWVWTRFVKKPIRLLAATGVAILVLSGAGQGMVWAGIGAGHDLLDAAGVCFVLLCFYGFAGPVRDDLPSDVNAVARVVTQVAVVGFLVFAPGILLALASGGNWHTVVAAYDGHSGGSGIGGLAASLGRGYSLLVCPILLFWNPAHLRRTLPWEQASQQARDLVPAWQAAGAAIATWLFIVLQGVSGGVLADRPLGTVAVAGLGAATLLAPLYQFLARSCWQCGMGAVFDPVRWLAAWRSVTDEITRRPESGHDATPGHRPGPAGAR